MPVAEGRQEALRHVSAAPSIAAYNWPDTGPSARPRRGADVRRVAVEASYCRLREPKGKLGTDERIQFLHRVRRGALPAVNGPGGDGPNWDIVDCESA